MSRLFGLYPGVMREKLNRIWLSQKFDSDNKIIFVHIPKCGGTSLDSLIRKKFRFNRFKISARASAEASQKTAVDIHAVRGALLNYAVSLDYKFISGHFYLHHPEHYNDYKIITMLRNPVDRLISHYLYNRYKTHSTHDAINIEFEDFLNSDLAKDYGNLYCRYFSESQNPSESIKTLSNFSKVGILEHLAPFKSYIQKELELKGNLAKKNTSPVSRTTRSQDLLSTYQDKITKICRDDIEIYNHFEQSNLKLLG
ncbi:MAG: sulfotransferase family protein [Acidiferrobacterales bacterium]|nr:sulfotransferase family protein [Acidiferrobacterales bacterium]